MLRGLIDPNTADLRRAARETRELMIAANNGHVVTLDNLSHLTQVQSDDLCRLATGGGFSVRELYSDTDEILFDAIKPVLLNGIEEVASSGDILDRMLIVKMPRIVERDRREEEELWDAFEQAKPKILGAVFDAVSSAIANMPSTHLVRKPRMADMARWVTAAESGLGWEAGSFMASYDENRRHGHELAVDSSVIGAALIALVDPGSEFSGAPTELLAQLRSAAGEDISRAKGFPKTARGLRGHLDRLAPSLRGLGYQVDLDGRAGTSDRTRRWTILAPGLSDDVDDEADTPGSRKAPRRENENSQDGQNIEGADATVQTVHSVRSPLSKPSSPDDVDEMAVEPGRSPDGRQFPTVHLQALCSSRFGRSGRSGRSYPSFYLCPRELEPGRAGSSLGRLLQPGVTSVTTEYTSRCASVRECRLSVRCGDGCRAAEPQEEARRNGLLCSSC